MEWAFPRALFYCEPCAEGNLAKQRLCGQSSKKAWELRFWGWPLGSENDGDVTMMTMMMMGKT